MMVNKQHVIFYLNKHYIICVCVSTFYIFCVHHHLISLYNVVYLIKTRLYHACYVLGTVL